MDTKAQDWILYLKRNRRRAQETIYVKPGQRILAVKPPYILPKPRTRTIRVPSIERLKSIVANELRRETEY